MKFLVDFMFIFKITKKKILKYIDYKILQYKESMEVYKHSGLDLNTRTLILDKMNQTHNELIKARDTLAGLLPD